MSPAAKQMGVSDARANMTEVIAEVRLLGTPVVLTRRDKPQAALVPVEFYERALHDRALIEALRERAEEAKAGTAPGDQSKARILWEALHYSEGYVNDALNADDD